MILISNVVPDLGVEKVIVMQNVVVKTCLGKCDWIWAEKLVICVPSIFVRFSDFARLPLAFILSEFMYIL